MGIRLPMISQAKQILQRSLFAPSVAANVPKELAKPSGGRVWVQPSNGRVFPATATVILCRLLQCFLITPVYDEYSDDYEYLGSLTDKRRDYDDFLEDEKFKFIDLSVFIDLTWKDFEARFASKATRKLHQSQVIFRACCLLGYGLRKSCENTVATSIGTSVGYDKFRGRIRGLKPKAYGIVDFDM
ncbi:hypothetical protein GIB67_007553 [Kingdonia uniflora]|uniref:Uncharacterized protein n=1 Tax=Kingdonia uniflora TaxID=39325 RepID=A0A7J7LNG2_9MAGN|nr:hypothetical protein GIB67_007553 [Kingdonia uniflora]